jgi:hypothetical protein
MASNQQIGLDIIAHDLATATINRVNANVANFTQTTGKAGAASLHMGEGLRKASSAINHLAAEALGVNPTIARLSEGLLAFGVGGALVTTVAAGLAAVGYAISKVTEQGRQAVKAFDDFLNSLRKMSPFAIAGAAVDEYSDRIQKLSGLLALFPSLNGLISQSLLSKWIPALKLAEQAQADLFKGMQNAPAHMQNITAAAEKAYKERLKAQEKAAEEAARQAQQLLERNLARQRQQRIEAAGGGNVILPAGAAGAAGGIPSILAGATPEMREQARAAEAADEAYRSFGRTLANLPEVILSVGDALGAINASILGSIPGFGLVAKAAQKAVGIIAKVEGTVAIAQGAVKVAKSIFPFNPAELQSGLQMIATGGRLLALGGGGGGAGSAGGGGAGSGATVARTQEDIAREQGTVTIVAPRSMTPRDTEWLDFVAATLRELGGRRFVIVPGSQ